MKQQLTNAPAYQLGKRLGFGDARKRRVRVGQGNGNAKNRVAKTSGKGARPSQLGNQVCHDGSAWQSRKQKNVVASTVEDNGEVNVRHGEKCVYAAE